MKNQQRRLRNADEKRKTNKARSPEHQEIKDVQEKGMIYHMHSATRSSKMPTEN